MFLKRLAHLGDLSTALRLGQLWMGPTASGPSPPRTQVISMVGTEVGVGGVLSTGPWASEALLLLALLSFLGVRC